MLAYITCGMQLHKSLASGPAHLLIEAAAKAAILLVSPIVITPQLLLLLLLAAGGASRGRLGALAICSCSRLLFLPLTAVLLIAAAPITLVLF